VFLPRRRASKSRRHHIAEFRKVPAAAAPAAARRGSGCPTNRGRERVLCAGDQYAAPDQAANGFDRRKLPREAVRYGFNRYRRINCPIQNNLLWNHDPGGLDDAVDEGVCPQRRGTQGPKYHAFRDRDLLACHLHAAADSRLGLIHAAAPEKKLAKTKSSALAEAFDAIHYMARGCLHSTYMASETPRGYARLAVTP
jgi:hypothetical protein